jgi:hypothetical protein
MLAAAACSADSGPSAARAVFTEAAGVGSLAAVPEGPVDVTCGAPGQARVCGCAGGATGTQACAAGVWLPCACVPTPSATNSLPTVMVAGSPAASAAEPAPQKTGVTFDWPETAPGTAPPCKAGHYVGDYSCRLYIINTMGNGAFDVSGTIDMQLEQSAGGELLRVANGKFSGNSLAVIPLAADIVGELDCSAAKFTGRLDNGTFSVALGLGVPFTQGTFSGPLNSDYEPATAKLVNGLWNMMGELDGFPGTCMNGSWSAHYVE